MAPHAPMTYEVKHIDLEFFEANAYGRRRDVAGPALIQILKALKIGGQIEPTAAGGGTSEREYTRLAAAVTALLCDPGAKLSGPGYEQLAAEHPTLDHLFRASAFRSADHIVQQFLDPDTQSPNGVQVNGIQELAKLLLAYSLNSRFDVNFEALLQADPQVGLPAFLGALGHMIVLTPQAHQRRERLLALGPLLERAQLQDTSLTSLQRAFMHCSYAVGEKKHEIKRSLNRLSKTFLEASFELPKPKVRAKLTGQPTILVALEWFHSGHAMYRCYADTIRKLKGKFRLVGMGHETVFDEPAKQLFDQVVELKGPDVMLAEVLQHAGALQPDILYYPSVGMAWCANLVSVRLAPIQVATMGHPASTMSDAIDYVIVPERGGGAPECYSEILLEGEGAPSMVPHPSGLPAALGREESGSLRIAVPSMVAKLNAPFLALCRRLLGASDRKLEFHFFPGLVGLDLRVATMEIQRWIPEAAVHPRLDYPDYMARLGRCHLHLSPFPFGGTNSNIDSMRLAIPMVAFEGPEVHSASDAAMLRLAGLPETLIARSATDYEQIAARLIKGDEERTALTRQLKAVELNRVFCDASASRYVDDFGRLFWWIYLKHEEILGSGKRHWTVQDRRRAFPRHAS